MERINALIAEAIQRDGRSARELADASGISQTYLDTASRGYKVVAAGDRRPLQPKPFTITRLAQVLNVPADDVEAAGSVAAARMMRELPTVNQASAAQLVTELYARLVHDEDCAAMT